MTKKLIEMNVDLFEKVSKKIPPEIHLDFNSTSSKKWLQVTSPSHLKPLSRVQLASKNDISYLLETLCSAQDQMNQLAPYERAAILKSVIQKITHEKDFLASLIALEGGKPLKDARVEVDRTCETLHLCVEETLRLSGEIVPMERTAAGKNHLAFTLKVPIGPVLAISAFNHPLNLIAHQVGTALASGCCVVLKPAPSTPVCAYFFKKFFEDTALPSQAFQVISAEIPEIETLVSSSKFKFISFIGSAKVGWNLRKILAPGTRLSLEHGGTAPAVICEDANIELACQSLIKSSFYHAGQVCISTQIIYVHEQIFSTFVEKFSYATKKLLVGDALNEQTDVGPLIRKEEVQRLKTIIDEALSEGAELACGFQILGEHEQFLTPTVLLNVSEDSRIMKEEAFGPVVCIQSFSNEEMVLEKISLQHFEFEGALFSQNISKIFTLAQKFPAMTLVINNHNAFRVDQMPFGGHKESGLGMGGVKYMINEMSKTKMLIINTSQSS